MEWALVDGERRKATRGARGVCQCCGAAMISKCGRIKMWHWAHWPRSSCDPWWGGETEWHRGWKGRFPEEWREIVHIDDRTGEKHIADVKTPSGLVIEFQHSPLGGRELISRETFYEDMIWVVDGDRGTNDPGAFSVGFSSEPVELSPIVHSVGWWSQSRLLQRWNDATARVYIDFGGPNLWLLHDFITPNGPAYLSPLHKDWLVEACQRGEPIPLACVREENREAYVSQWAPKRVH